MTGIRDMGRTATVLLRGSNKLVLEEAERSLHDALCVIRCLVHKRYLLPGGSTPEVEITHQLSQWAKMLQVRLSLLCLACGRSCRSAGEKRVCRDSCVLQGMESYCVRAFAEALEVVPYTLAENAGLNPIQMVTELRNRHAAGERYAGLNARKGAITNMLEENVVQPLLVTSSAITLATECVRMILKVNVLRSCCG